MVKRMHCRQSMRNAGRSEHGSNVIEAVFVTVFLLILFAGIIDVGRAFSSYIVITNAAREGVRTASRLPCKSDNQAVVKNAIVNAAINEARNSGTALTSANITITPDPVNTGCAPAGTQITVGVTFPFNSILGSYSGFTTLTLSNSAKMVAFGSDQP